MLYKVIKTEEEYEAALERIEELFDVEANTPEEDELELLALLVEKYEEETCDMGLPDPIEAIKFRMDQQGLSRKDLTSYIGSLSKVSEVLNRKRSLSLSMIRALHEGLGISAEVLLQKSGAKLENQKYEIKDFPFNEMFKRGFFTNAPVKLNDAKEKGEELMVDFLALSEQMKLPMCCRQSECAFGDSYALYSWQAEVLNLANTEKLPAFHKDSLNNAFIKRIVKLSYFDAGPQLVKEALSKVGIHFIILKHLPKTHLDGACMYSPDGRPIVALTLRYDRMDNFWFTLLHELGHLAKGHLNKKDRKAIIDDTNKGRTEVDEIEDEADKFARDAFIPETYWKEQEDELLQCSEPTAIYGAAEELEVSPSVVAGRVRWENKNYTVFTNIVGNGQVRKLFEEELKQ